VWQGTPSAQCVSIRPYQSSGRPGRSIECEVEVRNHHFHRAKASVCLVTPPRWDTDPPERVLALAAGETGRVPFAVVPPRDAATSRRHVLAADVRFGERRCGQAAEGLQGQVDEQRQLLARLRSELAGAAQQLMQGANAELEQHAAERRRALHEVADRLRKRERDLSEIAEREGNDAAQRIQIAIGDVERRQVEQLQRIVGRETQRYAEAASQQFDTQIKTAREEAARRLSRELDLAVERFAREAEGVLTDRLNHVSDAAASRVEERLARLRAALERQRDDALQSLEDRAHQVESSLRERLHEIATDAEAERAIMDARLHELARRLDELATRA